MWLCSANQGLMIWASNNRTLRTPLINLILSEIFYILILHSTCQKVVRDSIISKNLRLMQLLELFLTFYEIEWGRIVVQQKARYFWYVRFKSWFQFRFQFCFWWCIQSFNLWKWGGGEALTLTIRGDWAGWQERWGIKTWATETYYFRIHSSGWFDGRVRCK